MYCKQMNRNSSSAWDAECRREERKNKDEQLAQSELLISCVQNGVLAT
jgi:hypothetical protein